MQIKQLRLNTLDNSRKSLARVLNSFHRGDMEEGKYRALVYGLAHYLQYWKLIKDVEIERRLDDLELKVQQPLSERARMK